MLNKTTKLQNTNVQYWDDRVLGQGATAIVYKGFHINESRPAAIKRVKAECYDISKNELKVWLDLGKSNSSQNIVTLYDYIEWNDGDEPGNTVIYFAMELAQTDLRKEIIRGASFLDNRYTELVGFLKDAASGLKWLHNQRIIHRDIKPENVLIFCVDGGRKIAKLGDFGISRKLSGTFSTGD